MSEEVKDLETTENIHRDSKGRNLSWQWTKKRTSSSLSFSVGRTFIVLSWLSMRRRKAGHRRRKAGNRVTGTEWQSSQWLLEDWLEDWLRLQETWVTVRIASPAAALEHQGKQKFIDSQDDSVCLFYSCFWHEWRIVGTKRKKTKSKRHIWNVRGSLCNVKKQVE